MKSKVERKEKKSVEEENSIETLNPEQLCNLLNNQNKLNIDIHDNSYLRVFSAGGCAGTYGCGSTCTPPY